QAWLLRLSARRGSGAGGYARYCGADFGSPHADQGLSSHDRRAGLLRLDRRARELAIERDLFERAGGQRQGPLPGQRVDPPGARTLAHPRRHRVDVRERGRTAGGARRTTLARIMGIWSVRERQLGLLPSPLWGGSARRAGVGVMW